MPAYKKLLKLQPRVPFYSRSDWNVLLVTALCALLVISPAVGAPLAASSMAVSSLTASSAPTSEAVLWWLGNHLSAHQSTPSSLCQALLPPASGPREVAALFTAFEHAATIHLQNSSGDCHLNQSNAAARSVSCVFAATEYYPAYLPLAVAARYDASRRLMEYSLTTPEAAARSGLRTNRYHE
jgi:hypothetical protein